jgi:hypothetical protein
LTPLTSLGVITTLGETSILENNPILAIFRAIYDSLANSIELDQTIYNKSNDTHQRNFGVTTLNNFDSKRLLL